MTEWFIFSFPLWLIGICSIVKVTLYFTYKSEKDCFAYFIYYPFMQIACTTNSQKRTIKKVQNKLSVFIMICTMIYLTVFISVGKTNGQFNGEIQIPTTSQNELLVVSC